MTAVRGRMADNTTNLPIHLVAAARVTRSGSAEPEAGYGLLGSAWSVGSIACTDRGEPICARQRNPRATGLSSVPAGPAGARARQFGRASIAPKCAQVRRRVKRDPARPVASSSRDCAAQDPRGSSRSLGGLMIGPRCTGPHGACLMPYYRGMLARTLRVLHPSVTVSPPSWLTPPAPRPRLSPFRVVCGMDICALEIQMEE